MDAFDVMAADHHTAMSFRETIRDLRVRPSAVPAMQPCPTPQSSPEKEAQHNQDPDLGAESAADVLLKPAPDARLSGRYRKRAPPAGTRFTSFSELEHPLANVSGDLHREASIQHLSKRPAPGDVGIDHAHDAVNAENIFFTATTPPASASNHLHIEQRIRRLEELLPTEKLGDTPDSSDAYYGPTPLASISRKLPLARARNNLQSEQSIRRLGNPPPPENIGDAADIETVFYTRTPLASISGNLPPASTSNNLQRKGQRTAAC